MKMAMFLCCFCSMLPAPPADAAFSWQGLATPEAGQLIFADSEGFAVRSGAQLRLFSPEGLLRREIRYEGMGDGAATVFPDAWAWEAGSGTNLKVYGASGQLLRAGSAQEVTGQPYLPTRVAKQGKLISLEVYGGLVQLDTSSWTPTFHAGGRFPDSPWGDDSFTFVRRAAAPGSIPPEEFFLQRFTPQGLVAAELKIPVWMELTSCLLPAYPLDQDELMLSANNETLVLDRRSLAIRQRLPWDSCGPQMTFARATLRAWWRGSALNWLNRGSLQFRGAVLAYGDHQRSATESFFAYDRPHASLLSPLLLDRVVWNGAGRLYTQNADGRATPYGFFDLTRPSVQGGGIRRMDLCDTNAVRFSLPVSGGQAPYSCYLRDGTPLPDCQYTYSAGDTCRFEPKTYGSIEYWVGDALGDHERAQMIILPLPEHESAHPSQTQPVHEYFNTALNHYFMTIHRSEQEFVARGGAGPGWVDLGTIFLGWLPSPPPSTAPPVSESVAVCRFYGTPGIGPNSHFYTLEGRECEAVKSQPGWLWEPDNAFYLLNSSVDGSCPPWTDAVWRAYNNRQEQNDANHRFSVDRQRLDAMRPGGWIVEGVAFCAPRILN